MVLDRGQLRLLPLRSLAIFCWVDNDSGSGRLVGNPIYGFYYRDAVQNVMLPVHYSLTDSRGDHQSNQVENDDRSYNADTRDVPRLFGHEGHGSNELVGPPDDKPDNNFRNQQWHQFHEPDQGLALDVPSDPLQKVDPGVFRGV